MDGLLSASAQNTERSRLVPEQHEHAALRLPNSIPTATYPASPASASRVGYREWRSPISDSSSPAVIARDAPTKGTRLPCTVAERAVGRSETPG
jgi:hypothetical protein